MTNARRPRWLLIAVSCWPLAYWAAFVTLFLPWWSTVHSSGMTVRQVLAAFWTIAALHILTMGLFLGLWVYALVRSSRADFSDPHKTLWLVGLIFAAPVVMPAFFWRLGRARGPGVG